MSARRSRTNSSDNPDEDNVRKKERLDCTIYKLKEKKGCFIDADDNKSNNSVSSASSKNNSKGDAVVVENPESEIVKIVKTFDEADFRVIPRTEVLNMAYCMWENTSNVCWLDASMALLAHNQTLRYECDLSGSTHLKKIIKYYNEAISLLNDDSTDWSCEQRLEIAKKLLSIVQDSSLEYLQPILKYKNGDPESAFCSLFNLIREDKTLRKYFDVKYSKSFLCEKCGKSRTTTVNKPIITLPKVVAFQPSSPCFVSECPSCKDQEQRIQVSYKNLPKCLIFHFENGAGKGELCPLDFAVSGREYKVTGLMTLEKSEETAIDHFVSWIREPGSDLWLECNDLNPDVLKFAAIVPNCIHLEDVCMIMFESFDDLGIIEIKTDESESTEKLNVEDEEADDDNIPFIDLSQDNEEHNSKFNSSRDTPSRKMCGEKNMSVCNEGDDLKFLNTICSSPSDSLTAKTDSDSQPDSFMKKLDLTPKTDESHRNFITSPENKMTSDDACVLSKGEQNNISLQDTLSPKYTDLIKKLAAQDDLEDSKALSPSDLNQTLESMKQNILSNASEKSPLKPSCSSARKEALPNKKRSVNACNSKRNGESQPTVVKLVASKNSQNGKENNKSSSTELIESDFLMEQHDKINQILATRKGADGKIKFPSPDKVKVINKHPDQKADSLAKVEESDTEDISSRIFDNDHINEKENQAKGSDLDEVSYGVFSDVPDGICERPPFPIEVKTTVIDTNIQSESKNQESEAAFFESMPIFPVEEKAQTSTFESQKKDESNYSVPMSTVAIKEKYKPNDVSSDLQFNDFLLKENSYNEMALIVKESEEITPENIIKVIRNAKPLTFSKSSNPLSSVTNGKLLTSSKSSNSLSSVTAKDKKRKKKVQGKDFIDVKMKSFSINVARLTPEEILQYSPGTVLENLFLGSSPDSTASNHKPLSQNTSSVVYQENFDDLLKLEPGKQKPGTKLQKKKGKLQESSSRKLSSPGESSSGVNKRKSKRQGGEHELVADASTISRRGGRRKQITSSEMLKKANPLPPSVPQNLTENISSPEKITQQISKVSPAKTRGRKKNLLHTKKAIETMNNSFPDHAVKDIPEALMKNQTTSKSGKLFAENMPSCEVGKKWGKKERQPALEETKLISNVTRNESSDSSSALALNSQKRKRVKKEDGLSNSNSALLDQKNPDLLEEIDLPVRKSNRKRVDAFASLKDNYILESTDSKPDIPSVWNQESVSVVIKQEASQSKISTSDVKIVVCEDSDLDEVIPKSKRGLRKRNYIVSSSESDLNTEILTGKGGPLSLSKNATSSCTSASEAELIDAGNVKSGRRRKRKLSGVKSEDTLSRISEKLGETKSNVLKIISLSPVKEQLNKKHPVEGGVSSPIHIGRELDNGPNELSSRKEIKIESTSQMLTKSQVAKVFPSAPKRGRKVPVDLISGAVSNSINEPRRKIMKKESESSLSQMRDSFKSDFPLQDGASVPPVDVVGRKNKTTHRKNKHLIRTISPRKSNRDVDKSRLKSFPNGKASDPLAMAIDSIIDFYTAKAYTLFGVGEEESKH